MDFGLKMLNRRGAIKFLSGGLIGFGAGGLTNAMPNLAFASQIDWSKIDAYLDKARIDWRAPGLAIAIVKDGALIYAKGFGFANIDTKKPVNENTIFNVGSTTKAFTAAGIAMLVDQKKLDWDAPIREYLPSFKLGHGDDYASTNLRDMMSHRTGLARHELLWYNNKNLSHEALLEALPHLNTFAPLRAKYQYNNLMVMLSGHAIERVTGQSWEEYTNSKIFKPIGMTRSSANLDMISRDANAARGHRLNDKKEAYSIPLRPEDRIGPAGAINSSVSDFAKWIAIQLGKGSANGIKLFSNAQSNEMWEPLISTGGIPSSPELSRGFYGLGWRSDTYRGMLRVAHGGNLNGFASRVSLFPEKNIGIVAFTNLGGSPLPGHVTLDVLDMLLDLPPSNWSARNLARRDAVKTNNASTEPKNIIGTKPSHELSSFGGRFFNKGYGEMLIKNENNSLSASYNDMPMRLEHWHYDVFNAINERSEDFDLRDLKFVFATDELGQINSVSVKMDGNTPPVIFDRISQ